jgi:hypothetical protein
MLQILVGSHNYNLNNENSDKDYKIFVCPTFEDLYYNKKLSKVEKIGIHDMEYKDIRTLPALLKASHPNNLELLYSKEVITNNLEWFNLYNKLTSMREEIVTANLSNLVNSVKGNILKNIKTLLEYQNGNYKTSKHYKTLKTILRLNYFLNNFFITKNFENSLKSIDSDKIEKLILEITKRQQNYVKYLYDFLKLMELIPIKNSKNNEKINKKVEQLIFDFVKVQIKF